MRVTSKPSSTGAAPAMGVGKPATGSPMPAAVQGLEAVGDALNVSSSAQFIAVAEAHLARVPDVRLEKVDALKAQLASDQYHPDGDSVARGLVKEHMPPAES